MKNFNELFQKKQSLSVSDFDVVKELLLSDLKKKLCDWLGKDRLIMPFEWLFLVRDKFPFAMPKHMFWPFGCKVSELDPTPLSDYLECFRMEWNEHSDELYRQDLYKRIIQEAWYKIMESVSSVWGG